MAQTFLMLTLLLFGGPQANTRQDFPPELFRVWLHSHEEDANDVSVFRPKGYNFPRARGREGFEIKSGGEFIFYEIAPSDGSQQRRGRWDAAGKNRIRVCFDDSDEAKPLTLDIISLKDDVLKVKLTRE
jgi:hypothetical protein